MENNKSFIDDILSQWNVQTTDLNTYINSYNDKNLIVDIHPFEITDLDKNWQVEIFYRKFLDKNISRSLYFDHEQRYLRFIKYLWLYNSTDVFYDLRFDNYFRKGLKRYNPIKKAIDVSDEVHNIASWLELEELAVLALREAGYIFLHFRDWNIIVMINDFSILVLCREAQTTSVVKNLAINSGLFVRLLPKTQPLL